MSEVSSGTEHARVRAGRPGARPGAGGARRAAPPRNLRIEALRLLAIVGISLFHTMMPWTALALCEPQACTPDGALLSSTPVMLAPMGLIALLGAWGNHVFYMISGFFLIPSLARRSDAPGYWRSAAVATARRLAVVAASMAFYAAIAFAVDAWIVPLPGVATLGRWTLGLEFVWLYAGFVAVAPALAWVLRRAPRRAVVPAAALLLAAVFALNAYIAFVAPGDVAARGLTDWRKWMSAVTYAASFAAAGVVGMTPAARGAAARRRRNMGRLGLAAVLAATVLVEVVAACLRDVALIGALSFKSTSALSFLLALAALWCAATAGGAGDGVRDLAQAARLPAGGADRPAAARWAGRAVGALASGILGFYIVQSVFSSVFMDAGIQPLLAAVWRRASAALGVGGGSVAFLLAALACSAAFVVLVAAADRGVRQPVMRLLRLQ